MKNVAITLIFLLLSAFSVHATSPASSYSSDTLLLRNGYTYKVRVTKIVADTVFFKTYSSEEVKFFLTKEVKIILYDDGRIVQFDTPNDYYLKPNQPVLSKKLSASEMYEQGYRDGKFYYENRGIFWAGFGMGLFWWLYFLPFIPTIAMSLISPSVQNQISNDARLKINKRRNIRYIPLGEKDRKEVYEKFKDINYIRGYSRAAKGKKAGKVWLGFLTGFVGSFIAFILIYVVIVLLIFAFFI
jgi:hypothetical protein